MRTWPTSGGDEDPLDWYDRIYVSELFGNCIELTQPAHIGRTGRVAQVLPSVTQATEIGAELDGEFATLADLQQIAQTTMFDVDVRVDEFGHTTER